MSQAERPPPALRSATASVNGHTAVGPRPRFVLVIAILFALQITDGIDQAVLSFTAPFVRKELGIGIESIGTAFSAGFIGTAAGAVLFGTLADFIRKKNALLLAVMSFAVGCFSTTFVRTGAALILVRFLTGLALGGLFPIIASSIFDIVPPQLRARAITLTSVGSAAGVSLCGPLVATVQPHFGWRSVFIIGALIPTFLSILTMILIPNPARSNARSDSSDAAARNLFDSVASLFRADRWKITLLLWAAFIASAVPMFFALSWLPSLAHQAHLSATIAAVGPSIFAVSGLIFTVLIAPVIDKIGYLFIPVAVTMGLGAPAFMLLGQSFKNEHAFLLACGLAGALSIGSVNLMGVVAGVLYEDGLRARGIGWAVATMRFGAALAPWLGGLLLGRALPVQVIFLELGVSPILAGLAMLTLWQIAKQRGFACARRVSAEA